MQLKKKLRYLSSFYKNALEENVTGVYLETEHMALAYFKICQSKIFSLETAQTCILVWD